MVLSCGWRVEEETVFSDINFSVCNVLSNVCGVVESGVLSEISFCCIVVMFGVC